MTCFASRTLERVLWSFPALVMASFGEAAEIEIVALGASHTYSKGVERSDTYPAQLERLLRAKGFDVRIVNEGFSGDTTWGMLARLNRSLSDRTKLLILQPGGNDARARRRSHGPDTMDTIAEIVLRAKTRGIAVAVIRTRVRTPVALDGAVDCGMTSDGITPSEMQFDQEHWTPAGYAIVAARVASCIIPLLQKLDKSRE